MRRRLLFQLALLIATSLVMVALLELALRRIYPIPPTWLDPQATHLESPLLGWVLPPGLRAYTIDAPVSVNSLGYRDDEFPREKPPGELRVLALGDSFTFALGVRFEDLWSEQLERMLDARSERDVQVINGGVAGYNTRQELILLESEGFALDPDVVVVAFYWNDLVGNDAPLPELADTPKIADPDLTWERGEREQRHLIPTALRNQLRKSVLLYHATQRVKALLAWFDEDTGVYSVVQRALLEGDAATLEPYWAATRERLLQIARSARERGVPIVLLVFPMENEIKYEFPAMNMSAVLAEIWAETGNPFVDVGPAFRESLRSGENPFLPYDLHPNATGMRIAAEHLLRSFEDHGLVPPAAAPARQAAR